MALSPTLMTYVIHRPGVYNIASAQASSVIQPFEHSMVNGFPVLLRQLQRNVTRFNDIKFPQRSIEFIQCDSSEFTHLNFDPSIQSSSPSHRYPLVLNHPQQRDIFAANNLKHFYVPISADDWQVSDRTIHHFGYSNVSTCLDICHYDTTIASHNSAAANNGYRWRKVDRPDCKYFDRKLMTYLCNDESGHELVLFGSNHLSLPLSMQLRKLIWKYRPNVVVIESDSTRMDSFVKTFDDDITNVSNPVSPSGISIGCGLSSLWRSFYQGFFDIGMTVSVIKAFDHDRQPHLVLADWNVKQRRNLDILSRHLDSIQSQDVVDQSWPLTLITLGQFLSAKSMPPMTDNVLNQHYNVTLRNNTPHWHCIFDKRNDIFSCTINNLRRSMPAKKRILGVFGHAHILPIVSRLEGSVVFGFPFEDLGSHNIRL